MMWLSNNMSTIVVCIVLIGVVTAIIVRMIKNKKQGKSSCGCGCQDCAMRNSCHSRKR